MEIKNTNKQSESIAYHYPTVNATVDVCSYILETIIKFSNQKERQINSVFDSDIHQKQSIADYMMRIVKYFQIDENILILSMMNLDKLMLKNQNLIINKFNCYKIFFACLLETNKLYDDFVIPKTILCKVALVDSRELIAIEAEFLQKVNYSLYIEETEFSKYKLKLKNLHDKIKVELENQKAESEVRQKLQRERNDVNYDDFLNGASFKRKCSYFGYTNVNNNYKCNASNEFMEIGDKNICEL